MELLSNGEFYRALVLLLLLGTAAVIDWREQIIPDRLILAGLIVGLGLAWLAPLEPLRQVLLRSLLWGGGAGLFSYASRGGVGLGDAKLVVCMALLLTTSQLFAVLFWASCLSAAAGVLLLWAGKATLKAGLPFAPFVLAGSLLTYLI